jgi:hypothetical protein
LDFGCLSNLCKIVNPVFKSKSLISSYEIIFKNNFSSGLNGSSMKISSDFHACKAIYITQFFFKKELKLDNSCCMSSFGM